MVSDQLSVKLSDAIPLRRISGTRVILRHIEDEDLPRIEPWLDEAAAAGIPHPLPLSRGAGEGRSVGPRSRGALVIQRIAEDEPIGIVEYTATDGWLTVLFIALAKAYRGWGYGSEAVRLLEEWAIREGIAERFRAEVDVGNGLGLYFWLRLGYRPAGRDEFGWRRERERDTMAMVRVAWDKG